MEKLLNTLVGYLEQANQKGAFSLQQSTDIVVTVQKISEILEAQNPEKDES
jgi:hypothetical protein